MFVSQDEHDVKSLLRVSSVIQITEKDNKEDIKEYSRSWAGRIGEKFQIPPDSVNHITTTVCDRAEGKSERMCWF